jgi:amino acid adenylation domain-containing protein
MHFEVQSIDSQGTDLGRAETIDRLTLRLGILLGSADPIESVHTLSPVQEGMFFESMAGGLADAYLVQQRIEVKGRLDHGAFQRAWSLVIQRHAALRTVFVGCGGDRPVQVVCRDVPFAVELVDLVGDPSPDERIGIRMKSDKDVPFDLEQPPLIRIVLFRLGPERHQILLSQPHLLQDGWSAANVLDEVFEAYGAYVGAGAPTLAPVRPAGDFFAWLESRDPKHREAFWRGQLQGLHTPTRLARVAGGEGATDVVRRHFRSLELDLTAALRKLARRHRVSLSALLTGAWAIVAGRYTGQSEVVFYIVTAGRPATLPGVESMVGMFINTLPFRISIDDEARVSDWLRLVHSRQAALLEHEHTPLSVVQSWSELDAGTPLTDTLVAFGKYPAGSTPGEGVSYRSIGGSGRTGFPLAITVEATDPIEIGLHFDSLDFDPRTVDGVFDSLDTLLRSIVRDVEVRVGELEILGGSAAERFSISHDETRTDFPTLSFPELFADRVAVAPDRPAAIFAGETLTYGELDSRVGELAGFLSTRGARRGEKVAVCLERSFDLLITLMAIQKVGAAFVPLDPALPAERLRYMTGEARAGLVVTSESISARVFAPSPSTVITLETVRPEIDGRPPFEDEYRSAATDLAYVIFTSGSTGTPKGVAVTHGALTNFLLSMRERPGLGPNDVLLAVTTPSFDIAILELFLPLTTGATVVIAGNAAAQDPVTLVDMLDEWKVTVLQATPTRWRQLLATGWTGKNDLTVLCGGEALSRDLADRLLAGNRAVWNLYGPTEATIWASTCEIEAGNRPITIGTPIHNSWMHVLDGQMRPVPDGVSGRLFIGGACLAEGYFDRPELTAERFVLDPFRPARTVYDTGDLARRTRYGIECLGRSDSQVKVRGHRIELGEIEQALRKHPGVADCAAAVRPRTQHDTRIVAYYTPATGPGAAATSSVETTPEVESTPEIEATPEIEVRASDLRSFVATWLPPYMVPQHFVRLDALPRTANQKLDRNGLPDPFLSPSTQRRRPPGSEAERAVVDACSDLLGGDAIDLAASFFDLGGHSLLAMRLALLLEQRTGIHIDPRILISTTLEDVATTIARGRATGGDGSASHPRGSVGLWKSTAPTSSPRGRFFPSRRGRLFGIHHPPPTATLQNRTLLLCPAVGWEYTHAHWALHSLARLGARNGFHVLRFDYGGTGDSDGSGDTISIDRWIDDVGWAKAELTRASGVDRVSIVGLRLGGSIAAAACAGGLDIAELVLWDPVVSGDAYLRSQERMHGDFLAQLRTRSGRRRSSASLARNEFLGHPFPESVRRWLGQMDLGQLAPLPSRTSIIASHDGSAFRELADASGGAIGLDIVADHGNWEDLASRESLVLASKIPTHIISMLARWT